MYFDVRYVLTIIITDYFRYRDNDKLKFKLIVDGMHVECECAC